MILSQKLEFRLLKNYVYLNQDLAELGNWFCFSDKNRPQYAHRNSYNIGS